MRRSKDKPIGVRSRPRAGRHIPVLIVLCTLGLAQPSSARPLTNAGFEALDAKGDLIGWTILTGLDGARYGSPRKAAAEG